MGKNWNLTSPASSGAERNQTSWALLRQPLFFRCKSPPPERTMRRIQLNPYRRNLSSPGNTAPRRNKKEMGSVEQLRLGAGKYGGKGQIFPLKKGAVLPLGLEQEQEDIKQSQILRRKKDRNFGGQETISSQRG